VNHVVRSEGRAAARRGRNDIRLVPCSKDTVHGMPEVIVVTTRRAGIPLQNAELARGQRQLIVVPDEDRIEIAHEQWTRLGARVQFAHLEMPTHDFVYPEGVRERRPALAYDRALAPAQ